MFDALRKLFRREPAPAAPASDRDEFLRSLIVSDVIVIAAMQSEGIPPADLTQARLLEEIRRAAERASHEGEREPFVYEAGGRRRLPFFTDNAHAETFVGECCRQHDRTYPFEVLTIKGAILAQLLPACDVLVMNDGSEDEVEFSGDDMAALQHLCGGRPDTV